MRELVGPTDLSAFDNPSRKLAYDYLDPAVYEKVFDFGCGCGRVARQMMLQNPSPKMYVGIDLHPGMIRWCQRNLQPVAPNFTFFHHDVYHVRFNPLPGKPLTATFPVEDGQFTLVNALSVFTHLTQEHAVFYLRECARVLHPDGVLHASWFFFDKREYPMMQEHDAALYVSYVDPGAAVIFDRNWVVATAREMGLRVCKVVPPSIRGHQWAVIMTRREDVEEAEFPPDTAPVPGQACHLQHPGQHRIVGHKADVIEAGEPNVDGQDHRQHELIDGHNTRDALHPQCFLDQLLETQLLQHRRHWEQTTIGGEILTVEVERGGSRDFIGFRNIYLRALLGAGFAAMLLFVLHLLGDLLEIGSRSCYFAASLFYNRISRVPKGFASSAPLQPLKCCA